MPLMHNSMISSDSAYNTIEAAYTGPHYPREQWYRDYQDAVDLGSVAPSYKIVSFQARARRSAQRIAQRSACNPTGMSDACACPRSAAG
jgi:hypothetical protein